MLDFGEGARGTRWRQHLLTHLAFDRPGRRWHFFVPTLLPTNLQGRRDSKICLRFCRSSRDGVNVFICPLGIGPIDIPNQSSRRPLRRLDGPFGRSTVRTPEGERGKREADRRTGGSSFCPTRVDKRRTNARMLSFSSCICFGNGLLAGEG